MAQRRARDEEEIEVRRQDTTRPEKKQRKGFQVGPANLPDGTYRRKAQKIKKDLIQKAKLKKSYAKLKEREVDTTDDGVAQSTIIEGEEEEEPASLELHPERQAMLHKPNEEPLPVSVENYDSRGGRKSYNQKRKPFARETEIAEQRKAEAEVRRQEREAAEEQKRQKIEERERFRRAMAKARSGGRNGQRKLGRESGILLEKVKRVMGTS